MIKVITFLRKVFVILPIIAILLYMFKSDFKDFIVNLYNLYFDNENSNLILIIISIVSVLYIINLIAFLIARKNKVNIKYKKDGNTFKLKGKKDNFIITKNGKHQFLVKDGMIVAYKPLKIFSKFRYYENNKNIEGE